MSVVLGLALGAGLLLAWSAFWVPAPRRQPRPECWHTRMQDTLIQAGAAGVTPAGLALTATGLGLLTVVLTGGLTGSWAIGLAFGAIAARGPFALVHHRANRRRASMRDVWPEVVDHLASGIRAGLSLPEAVAQLGERGPEVVRAPFKAFAEDHRASGKFAQSLDLLKVRLADPVADRIVEALRITREVGGTDVGRLLRTLSEFLREDARTRGELEARQSWTVNAARLAVAAPWIVLALLSTRGANASAFNSATGGMVLLLGGAATVVAYRLMVRLGRLPVEQRVLR